MTKKELIEQRVQQLLSLNYSEDMARYEANKLYGDMPDEEEAPVKKIRAKKEAAE
jgi:hypothetical protein